VSEAYEGKQIVGIDLHRRRSVLVGSSLYQVGLVIKWGWSRRGGLTKG
jgi:hypothetical protein